MRREKVECEGEIGGWENGEGFGEDGGYGVVAEEVGVELVSVGCRSALVSNCLDD